MESEKQKAPPGQFPEDEPKQTKGKEPEKPSTKGKEFSMSSQSSKFKPPKPRTYSGKGNDTKAHIFRQWRQEVADYFKLTGLPPDEQLITLGYFVSEAAKDYYQTKREENDRITVKEMLDGMRKHVIPSTQGNNYWNEWNNISQRTKDKTRRIGLVAIDIERVARCIAEGDQGQVGEGVRLQKLLDAMHPELRFQVEPNVNKAKFDWTEVVQLAEKFDDALYQAGRYGNKGRSGETNAIQYRQPNHQKQQQQKTSQTKKQYPPRKGNEQLYQQRKKNKECYFCGKKGHMIAECRSKRFKESGGQRPSSNSTELEIIPTKPETSNLMYQTTPHMTTTLKINGKRARVLLDTGTVGTNLMSTNWAQTNQIHTTKTEQPCEIKMATKNSRTSANYSATADVNIADGKNITCEFLLVPIASYDVILGMPFMTEARVILDPAESKATFKDHGTIIQCATIAPQVTATAATDLDLLQKAMQIAEHTLQDSAWDDEPEVRELAKQIISAATAAKQQTNNNEQLPNFAKEFPQVFPETIPMKLPPLRKGLNHTIHLDDSQKQTFRNEYRRIPESKLPQLRNWLKEWEENGIAKRGNAPYAAPIFGVPKKQPGEIRWVIDLKERNKITIRDYTPIPNQEHIRNDVARHNYRSKIDMSNAYYQIRVEPQDEEKNAITAGQYGAWQVKVMLQGDCNAPATMMRIMNTILSEYLGKFVWVYLDDILIFSETKEQHIQHLRQIFQKLQDHKFYLRMDKCDLMIDAIEILGHIIKGNEITPCPEKISHIADFPQPAEKKQLQQFLGSVNYIGGHLPHIATLQAPLTELTGNASWEWKDLQQTAFKQVKQACKQYLPISPIDYSRVMDKSDPYTIFLVTDASKVGSGAFLCHGETYEEAKKNIAAMHSRKFTPAQCNYTTTDQELLAIIDALKSFEHKLLGIQFTIITDHMALQTIMCRTVAKQRQIRWLETIKMFSFDIIHINGKENILADALSRIYEGIEDNCLSENDFIQEDQNIINTDGILPEEEEITTASTQSPLTQSTAPDLFPNTQTYPKNTISTFTISNQSQDPRRAPQPVTPTLTRSNAAMDLSRILEHQQQHQQQHQQWHRTSAGSDLTGTLALAHGAGCSEDPLAWDRCTARTRCDIHLADCIDTYAHRLAGVPSLTVNTTTDSGNPATSATQGTKPEDGPPWKQEPRSPTTSPITPQPFTFSSPQDPEKVRQIIQEGFNFQRDRHAQGLADGTIPPPQDRPTHVNPSLLQLPDTSPIEYPVPPYPDTGIPSAWEARPVQHPPTISGRADSTIQKPSPPQTRAVTRQRKRLEETAEEISKGEGNGGKMDWESEKEEEKSEDETEQEEEGSDMEHSVVDEEEELQEMEEEDEEDESDLTDWDGEFWTEPNFIWNEGKHTLWGQCYLDALEQDPDFGQDKPPRMPFYKNDDGFILKRNTNGDWSRVYIPKGRVRIGGEVYDMRELLIHSAHHRLQHYGTKKTYKNLARDTVWPGQWKQTQRFTQTCDVCQRNKQPTQKPAGIAQVIQIPLRPWQSLSMDVLGPLPLSSGYKHVLVVVDRFSSSVRTAPLKDRYTARDICDALIKHVYSRHGIPREIITDRGPQFVSNFNNALHQSYGVDLLPSTAFHQQTNGSAERANKSVTQVLRCYVNAKQNDWVEHLWRAEYAINNSSTEWTDRTPTEICQGQVANLEEHTEMPTTQSDAIKHYLENLDISNQIAHDALTLGRYKQGRYSQPRRNTAINFKVGEQVMYPRRTYKKGLAHKLQSTWRGPYQVTKIDKHGNCHLNIPRRYSRHPVFAPDMLKKYHDNPEHQRETVREETEDNVYLIERIIDQRQGKDGLEYLVQWKGYDEDENTWEPARNIEEDAPGAVEDFRDMLAEEVQDGRMEE